MAVLLCIQGGIDLIDEMHGLLPPLWSPVPGEVQGSLNVIVNVVPDQPGLLELGGSLLVMGKLLCLQASKGRHFPLPDGQANAVFIQLQEKDTAEQQKGCPPEVR